MRVRARGLSPLALPPPASVPAVGADFSKTNLRALEDMAPKFGLPEGFEARFAKSVLDASELAVSLQKLGPKQSSPFAHRHNEQPEELYVVVAGSGSIVLDGDAVELAPWDVVRVAGPVTRSFVAGPDGLEFVAFGRSSPSDAEIVQL